MRKNLIATVCLAALVAGTVLFASLSPAGGQQEGVMASFEILKDVHGDGPTTGFVVEFSCADDSGAPLFGDSVTLADGESVEIPINEKVTVTCSIVEIEDNGADLVEYECEFFPANPDSPPEGDGQHGCLDDQSARFLSHGDFASFLVRNTFDPEVLPDDDEPPPDVAPDVVDATPSFTG